MDGLSMERGWMELSMEGDGWGSPWRGMDGAPWSGVGGDGWALHGGGMSGLSMEGDGWAPAHPWLAHRGLRVHFWCLVHSVGSLLGT